MINEKNIDDFLQKNITITNDLNKIFINKKYNSINCIVSMLSLSIQQFICKYYGNKEDFDELVSILWKFVEENPNDREKNRL